MYRKDGPAEFKPLGETEFVNGLAAMLATVSMVICKRVVGQSVSLI